MLVLPGIIRQALEHPVAGTDHVDCMCCRASELRECAGALHSFHLKASLVGREQTAIHEKYSQHRYHSVATCLAPPQDLPAKLFEDPEASVDQ